MTKTTSRSRVRPLRATLLLSLLAACATRPPADPWSGPRAALAEPGTPLFASSDEPAVSDFAEEPPLRALLERALVASPRIAAARERALAAAQGSRVEGALPDPMVMLGWYATPVETRVGAQRWSLTIQQRIPWPGRLAARSRIADTLAERERVLYERAVRDVLVEVARSAWELAYLDEADAITAGIEPLLARYEAEAAAPETDAPLREHLRAATQRAMLANDRIVLAELRAAEAERLRALLDLPPESPIGTPVLPAPPPLEVSYDGLLAAARAHSQDLRAAGLAVDAALDRLELAKQERRPDFTVGYTHIFTDPLDPSLGMDPAGNGDDPQIVQLGLSLPLWVGKNRAQVAQADAQARAALQERTDADATLRTVLARTWYEVGNAERLALLYDDVLLPRAEEAVRTAEDLQAAGKGSTMGTIETVAALHQFRLAAARARADRGRAIAALEGVVGTPLGVRRGEEER